MEPHSTVHKMLPMIFGAVQGKAIGLAAELGIADLLDNNPMRLQDLAAATKTNVMALERFLNLLVKLDIVAELDICKAPCSNYLVLLQVQARC